jgi:hypothetical protein
MDGTSIGGYSLESEVHSKILSFIEFFLPILGIFILPRINGNGSWVLGLS